MSRTSAQKRIHYVRAVYLQGKAPPATLEKEVRVALKKLKNVGNTEISHPALGTIAARERGTANRDFVTLGIGLGVPDEAMGTLGLGVTTPQDKDQPQTPSSGRAFKLADAFCLVDDDEVLVCTDGRMRLPAVTFYLRNLLDLANAKPEAQAFELTSRMDQDKQKTLETEGVKEMKVKSSAYAATRALQNAAPTDTWLRKGWLALLENLRDAMASDVPEGAERDALIGHWSDLNVSATFNVKGGSQGEPVMVRTLEDIAIEAQRDAPDGTEVTLITKRGNPVNMDTLTLKGLKSIKRLQRQNDLDYADAWNKLIEYRQELMDSNRWKV